VGRRLHGQDRAVGVEDDALGHAAEEHLADRRTVPDTDHDQEGAVFTVDLPLTLSPVGSR
jgi:hypothetical protein